MTRGYVDDSLLASSGSGVSLGNSSWCLLIHYERLLWITRVVLLRSAYCDLGWRMFWGAPSNASKFQHFLITISFSSVLWHVFSDLPWPFDPEEEFTLKTAWQWCVQPFQCMTDPVACPAFSALVYTVSLSRIGFKTRFSRPRPWQRPKTKNPRTRLWKLGLDSRDVSRPRLKSRELQVCLTLILPPCNEYTYNSLTQIDHVQPFWLQISCLVSGHFVFPANIDDFSQASVDACHQSTFVASYDNWWWNGVKEGTLTLLWRCWLGELACKNRPRNDL